MPPPGADREGGLVALTVLALISGLFTGVVGAAFRASLDAADRFRNALIGASHEWALIGFLLIVLSCAAAASIAAWMVRRFSPLASGSGIPHVEAVLRDGFPPAPPVLAPVKFVGGVLAIGSGLALGREGPTVQMGATIAALIGQTFRAPWADCRALLAAGAGAGLATAFNAPLAGAAFVLEELIESFDQRITIAGLAAAATAIAVMRALIGNHMDFHIVPIPDVSAESRVFFFALGAVLGLVGLAYNRTVLAASALAERLPMPVEVRAALIGASVGAIAWVWPGLVGGGDPLTQSALDGSADLAVLPAVFLARFVLGAASYATGTPGGLFAPLLTLGAQFGLMFGSACRAIFPWVTAPAQSFALVGMAAFFAATVRAPLTGMILVSEMTGNGSALLPMLGACAIAMLVPKALGEAPIYDSLREAFVRKARRADAAASAPRPPAL